MIDPATGWFKIKQYDDKKSITVANIVKQEWLARYPRPYLITLDQGSEFVSQDCHDMRKRLWHKKKNYLHAKSKGKCHSRAGASDARKFNTEFQTPR